jgi:hypothetical protein
MVEMLKKLFSGFALAAMLLGTVSVSEARTISSHPKPVNENSPTYITSLKSVNGQLVGKFDYIQWYFGKAADREFLKDCKCSKDMQHAPDGYWIRNVNPRIRTFAISKYATYVLQTRGDDIKWNEKVTKAQFLDFLKKRNKDGQIPFHIQVKNGVVVKITEQYIP